MKTKTLLTASAIIAAASMGPEMTSFAQQMPQKTNIEMIFDANYYATQYKDVAVVTTDPKHLLEHYLVYGINEGRNASKDFNLNAYVSANPDVKAAFGSDIEKICEHYEVFGKNENRITTIEDAVKAGYVVRSIIDEKQIIAVPAISSASHSSADFVYHAPVKIQPKADTNVTPVPAENIDIKPGNDNTPAAEPVSSETEVAAEPAESIETNIEYPIAQKKIVKIVTKYIDENGNLLEETKGAGSEFAMVKITMHQDVLGGSDKYGNPIGTAYPSYFGYTYDAKDDVFIAPDDLGQRSPCHCEICSREYDKVVTVYYDDHTSEVIETAPKNSLYNKVELISVVSDKQKRVPGDIVRSSEWYAKHGEELFPESVLAEKPEIIDEIIIVDQPMVGGNDNFGNSQGVAPEYCTYYGFTYNPETKTFDAETTYNGMTIYQSVPLSVVVQSRWFTENYPDGLDDYDCHGHIKQTINFVD